MKRDFDLIRSIMMEVEMAPAGNPVEYKDAEVPQVVINQHILLLKEAGFLDVIISASGHRMVIERITWAGHDMLDSMRDESIWNQAKEKILTPVGNVALDVLIEWMKLKLREKLGMTVN